jgi:hypothetical protein
LPDSLAREVSLVTWFEHACAFMDARWPKHAAKGRVSLAEGLIAVTPVLVKNQRGAPDPDVLRRALRKWAFNPPRRDMARPSEIEAALRWLARASVPMSALEEASMVARALDACGRKLDGSAASAQYYRRRRRVFYAALKYAVREKRLSANPLDGVQDREWKAPEVDHAVDRAVHLVAGTPEGQGVGVHSRAGRLATGPQALRLPSRRDLLAPQRGHSRAAGGRVGRSQRRSALPDLCVLPGRGRRAVAQADG